jgi:hypothetical protein
MREPRRLTTLWSFMACYRDSFTFLPFAPLHSSRPTTTPLARAQLRSVLPKRQYLPTALCGMMEQVESSGITTYIWVVPGSNPGCCPDSVLGFSILPDKRKLKTKLRGVWSACELCRSSNRRFLAK